MSRLYQIEKADADRIGLEAALIVSLLKEYDHYKESNHPGITTPDRWLDTWVPSAMTSHELSQIIDTMNNDPHYGELFKKHYAQG